MSEPTIFDDVNFHPDEWRFYTKGTRIACDDLGACTSPAMKDGWYLLETAALGSYTISYMPPEFDPAWLEDQQ